MEGDKNKRTQEEWERAIASYHQSYRDLIAFATHLIETGRDLSAVAEIVDGLSESQSKGILKVVIASDANDYTDQRTRSRLNGWSYPTSLIEALDWMVETWSTPRTATSREAAHEAGCQVLEVLDEEYGDLDPNEVIPDLVNQMLAQSESDSVWLGRTAALGCIVEGVIQAEAAEQAQNK